MPAAWPAYTDLSSVFTDAGLTAPSNARMTGWLAAAVASFNKATGYLPFLATTQTRKYDPPGAKGGYLASNRGGGRILRLDNGLAALTSLSIAGVAKTVDTDFWLMPQNATQSGKPYEYIEFFAPHVGTKNAISITGKFGYSETVPDDAWHAVLYEAFAIGCYELAEGSLNSPLEWKEGDVSERLGSDALVESGNKAHALFDRVAKSYLRTTAFV